jgi:hypothetical protein
MDRSLNGTMSNEVIEESPVVVLSEFEDESTIDESDVTVLEVVSRLEMLLTEVPEERKSAMVRPSIVGEVPRTLSEREFDGSDDHILNFENRWLSRPNMEVTSDLQGVGTCAEDRNLMKLQLDRD